MKTQICEKCGKKTYVRKCGGKEFLFNRKPATKKEKNIAKRLDSKAVWYWFQHNCKKVI